MPTLPVMQGLHTEVYELPICARLLNISSVAFHWPMLCSSISTISTQSQSSDPQMCFIRLFFLNSLDKVGFKTYIYLASQIYLIAESVDLSCKLIITWKSEAHKCSATAFQFKSTQLQGSCHNFSTSTFDAAHDPVYLLTVSVTKSPGGGHGKPLQSSCLENPCG